MTDTVSESRTPAEDSSQFTRHQKALESIFGAKFVNTFASPYMVMEDQQMASPVTVRFYKKDFAYLSKQLYLEYQYRSWKGYSTEVLQRYAEITSTKLGNIRTMMNNNIARLRKLLDMQGHKGETLSLWPSVKQFDVPIITALPRSYVEVLKQLDQVYTLAGTAHLLGVIDSEQRNDVEFISKKAVRAFRSILQTEVIKLYREAQRLIREQQGIGGDHTMHAIVEQQGKDIAAFDAVTAEDELTDSSMSLGGADPSQVIDDAAAASTAAAAAVAGTRRKAAAKKAESGDGGATAADAAIAASAATAEGAAAPAAAVLPAAA